MFRFQDARSAAGKFWPTVHPNHLTPPQALITAHSSLVGVERQNVELFKERLLPDTVAAFNRLRRAVDLTIRDIGSQLGCKPMV